MNYSTSKNSRILDMYVRLCEGKTIYKREESQRFGVAGRTIQRDIEDIRAFLSDRAATGIDNRTIIYNRSKKCFELYGAEGSMMSNAEILATSKILLESRAFTKKELGSILNKLIAGCASPKDSKLVSDLISNERFYYVETENQNPVKDIIWNIGNYIKEQRIVEIIYNKPFASTRKIKCFVAPLSIIFFESYFYLVANDLIKTGGVYKKQTDSFTLFRFDCIAEYKSTEDRFRIDYNNRFEEGLFRKQLLMRSNESNSNMEFVQSAVYRVNIA